MAGKPSLALAFGPAPKDAPAGDDSGELPPDGGDDTAPEGLQAACDEFLDALGLTVDEDKKAAACEALKSFVSMASTGG